MAGPNAFPTHAYVPGFTERHTEGAFDHIRNTALEGMAPQALSRSDAFQVGLRYLESGYYWEAHELLEPVWMALPERSDARHLVQALIQLANARLKVRMQKPKAARRLCGITRGLLCKVGERVVMDVDIEGVVQAVDSLEQFLSDVL